MEFSPLLISHIVLKICIKRNRGLESMNNKLSLIQHKICFVKYSFILISVDHNKNNLEQSQEVWTDKIDLMIKLIELSPKYLSCLTKSTLRLSPGASVGPV